MNILYFGDVYGMPGRQALEKGILEMKSRFQVDFTIVNGENMSHGNGILPEMADDFFAKGVDCITTGNHAWDQRQIIPYMDRVEKIIRPANYPDAVGFPTPGRGSVVLESSDKKFRLAVLQVMGRTFMDALDCPFRKAQSWIEEQQKLGLNCLFVDFHGEASSEKQAFANYMDGKASVVVGSHSHVQTADERLLPGGTAAITDVGMTGCYDSVIGVKKEIVIQKFLTKRPAKFEPATGPGGYGCVLVTIDSQSGRATDIQRFRKPIA